MSHKEWKLITATGGRKWKVFNVGVETGWDTQDLITGTTISGEQLFLPQNELLSIDSIDGPDDIDMFSRYWQVTLPPKPNVIFDHPKPVPIWVSELFTSGAFSWNLMGTRYVLSVHKSDGYVENMLELGDTIYLNPLSDEVELIGDGYVKGLGITLKGAYEE